MVVFQFELCTHRICGICNVVHNLNVVIANKK